MEEADNKLSSKNKDEKATMDIISTTDHLPWYAIRLFFRKQNDVIEYFEQFKLECFVPMELVNYQDKEGHIKEKLKPVIQNLIFVKKTKSEKEMREIFNNSQFPLRVYQKELGQSGYYEICAKEMYEFQIMCNPRILMRKFISQEQAKLKAGTKVFVKYGPLKGLSGKLVRSNKKYFLLKEVPGVGVMLKVSRWCCVPAADNS